MQKINVSCKLFEEKRRCLRRDKGNTLKEIYGGIAQLGEHLLCKQGVSGSIPLISTIRLKKTSRKPIWAYSSAG